MCVEVSFPAFFELTERPGLNLTYLMASGNYLSISSIELVIKVNM